LIAIACGVVLSVFSLPALVSAQGAHEYHADSKKSEVHLSTSLLIGTATLQPGDYVFQCRIVDGKTYLVATSAVGEVEVGRVPCTPVALDKKVTESDFRTTRRADGVNVLTSVRFKGETVVHTIVIATT
jgi:hypothetical protein